MSVAITTGEQFSVGDATPLFSDPGLDDWLSFWRYDVALDGCSFAVVALSDEALASPPAIRIVQIWYSEFRHRD